MKLRLASADTLVDIGRLSELKGVSKLEDGRLAVGALTTYAELMDSPAIHYGVLKDALPSIGTSRSATAGRWVAPSPTRTLPRTSRRRCWRSVRRSCSSRRPGHATSRPTGSSRARSRPRARTSSSPRSGSRPGRDDAGSAYVSLEQPASGYSLVGVAAVVIVGAGGVVEKAGIGITGVSSTRIARRRSRTPSRDDRHARRHRGSGGEGPSGRPVNSDIHANAEYRAAMAVVYTRRAIAAALARAA